MHYLYRNGDKIFKKVDTQLSAEWLDQYNKMSFTIPINIDHSGTVITMPYIDGISPSIKKHGKLIAEAIQEMIDQKFAHCDLDPANMIISNEQLYIIDPDSWCFIDNTNLYKKLYKAAYNGNTIRFYIYSFAINNRRLLSFK